MAYRRRKRRVAARRRFSWPVGNRNRRFKRYAKRRVSRRRSRRPVTRGSVAFPRTARPRYRAWKPTVMTIPAPINTDIARINFQFKDNFTFNGGATVLAETIDLCNAFDPDMAAGGNFAKNWDLFMGASNNKYQKYGVVAASYRFDVVYAAHDQTIASVPNASCRFFCRVATAHEARTDSNALDDDPNVYKKDMFINTENPKRSRIFQGTVRPGKWLFKGWHDRLLDYNSLSHPADRSHVYLSFGRYPSVGTNLQTVMVECTVNFTVMATDRVQFTV